MLAVKTTATKAYRQLLLNVARPLSTTCSAPSGHKETMKQHVEFFNGRKMPLVGLGTWQASREEVKAAVNTALEVGYRHFDSAYNYLNEDAVGEVLEEWIQSGRVKREDLFITTKLPMIGNRPEDVQRFLKISLKNLKLDYLDLYLVHFPFGMIGKHDLDVFPRDENGYVVLDMKTDLVRLWQAMETQVDAGLTKSIGVSNFNSEQIKRVADAARIRPANLQTEVHAYFQQKQMRLLCKQLGMTVCAYAPLGSRGRIQVHQHRGLPIDKIPDIFNNPVILEIAKNHSKSPAQVMLRHLIQQEVVVIPKSVRPSRIRENFDIFDFTLTEDEMRKVDNLDIVGGRTFDPSGFKGVEKHPEFPLNIPY